MMWKEAVVANFQQTQKASFSQDTKQNSGKKNRSE
jgi:hypothetical protein